MDVAVAAATLLLIVPVELPDKTFIATMVLATRYRPLLAWIGVGLAFGVQSLVAVLFGGLIAELPDRPVTLVAGLLFAIGAVVLWRGAAAADTQEVQREHEVEDRMPVGVSGLRAVTASFVVLFITEWGDLSQLLTAGLVVRYHDPVSVFVGSWAALLLVSGIGALVGRALLVRVRLATVQRVGSSICALLAVVTLLRAAAVDLPF